MIDRLLSTVIAAVIVATCAAAFITSCL